MVGGSRNGFIGAQTSPSHLLQLGLACLAPVARFSVLGIFLPSLEFVSKHACMDHSHPSSVICFPHSAVVEIIIVVEFVK